MAAVTASTKRESPKIEWAGVETGAKVFVGLRERREESARAATGKQKRTIACTANRMRQLLELLFRISSTSSQFTQERANQLLPKHHDRVPQSSHAALLRGEWTCLSNLGKRLVYSDPARKKGNGPGAHTLPSMDSIRAATPTRLHFLFPPRAKGTLRTKTDARSLTTSS